MSYQASEWAIQQRCGNKDAKSLLRALAHEANAAGEIRRPLTVKILAYELETNRKNVMLAIAILEELGLLVVGRERGTSSTYTLRIGASAYGTGVDSDTSAKNDTSAEIDTSADSDTSTQIDTTTSAEIGTTTSAKIDTGVVPKSTPPHNKEYKKLLTATTKQLKATAKSSTTDLPRTESPPPKTDDDDLAPSAERFYITRAPALAPRTYTEKQLREVAAALGDGFGFRGDWPGFGAWLEDLDAWTVEGLIVLLFHYGHQSQANMDRITNMPGMIRRNVERGRFVTLSGREARLLGQEIDKILILNELHEIAQPVDDEAYKRKSRTWVEPKSHDPTYQPLSVLLGVNR